MDERRRHLALIGLGLLATACGIGLFTTTVLKQGHLENPRDNDDYFETYPLGEIGFWFGIALLIVIAIVGVCFLVVAAARRSGAPRTGNQVTATGIVLAGIVATYLVFLILSQRGDMASAVFMHAIVACCFVLFVDVAVRMKSRPWAVLFVLLVTVIGALWLFLALLGLFIFGCGPEGCWA